MWLKKNVPCFNTHMLRMSKGTKTSGQAPSTFFEYQAFILRINAVSCSASSEEGADLILLLLFIFDSRQKVHRCTACARRHQKRTRLTKQNTSQLSDHQRKNKRLSETKITMGEKKVKITRLKKESVKLKSSRTTRRRVCVSIGSRLPWKCAFWGNCHHPTARSAAPNSQKAAAYSLRCLKMHVLPPKVSRACAVHAEHLECNCGFRTFPNCFKMGFLLMTHSDSHLFVNTKKRLKI